MFDKGETFSGVDYDLSLQAVEKLKTICPSDISMVQFALKWILMFDAVTCAIPGARNVNQVEQNSSASDIAEISAEIIEQANNIYDTYIKSNVHQLW